MAALGAGLATACSSANGDGSQKTRSADTTGNPDPTIPCTEQVDFFHAVPSGCFPQAAVQTVGSNDYESIDIFAGQPTAPATYFAFRFDGITGDTIDITVTAYNGDAMAWLLDSEFGVLAFNDDDPAGGTTNSHITITLPDTGSTKHFIAFREKSNQPTGFNATLNTLSGLEPLGYLSTRIQQADIDNGKYGADQLFGFSDFMFGFTFTLNEGLGNALGPPLAGPNPPPNSRRIHNGKFGGPDSTSCESCHFVGGGDGGGDLDHNLLQDGDGVNLASALVRNAPALLGDGYIQQLGIEMTADLQAKLSAATTAAAGGTPQTVSLASKGVGFGSITANPDGSVDFSQLQGVDKDLVIKPFGWKGRTALLRRFVEGGFQVHLGMATQALIAKHCQTPIPAVVGNGPDCTDPDNDGVRDEILDTQLTAMALYPALLQAPIRVPPTDPTAQPDVGEQLFNQIGCTSCHVQSLLLTSSVDTEIPDLGGQPFQTDLTVDGKSPRLTAQFDGSVVVELWSDLKRHDMGASLADPHDTFGGAVPANLFMTRPLWGVGVTAPYLHDGRAATLQDAIIQHDGEAATVRDAFRALDPSSQAHVVEFLQTLARHPLHLDD
jgi:hypothetical protein